MLIVIQTDREKQRGSIKFSALEIRLLSYNVCDISLSILKEKNKQNHSLLLSNTINQQYMRNISVFTPWLVFPVLHHLQKNLIPCVYRSRQAPMNTIILHTLCIPINKWRRVHIRTWMAIWSQKC